MKKNCIVCLLYAFFLSTHAYAELMNLQKSYSQVVAISTGPVWSGTTQNQTFYLSPEVEKTYTTDNVSNTLADGEVFIGFQKSLPYQWWGQFGVTFAVAGNAEISGNIWDDANPQFNNYIYDYKIKHTHINLKGKLLVDRGYWVIPWISASIGVGMNMAFDFSNNPTIFEALPNSNFTNHMTTTLTYTLGLGLQKLINQHWQLGIGYEFSDWGKSELGRAIDQTINSGLSSNHLYTKGVLFNVTYLA